MLSWTRTDDQIRAELVKINETIEAEDSGLLDLLEPWMRPALVVGVGLVVLQQVTDINTVVYYASTILESTGFEFLASIFATAGIGIVNVVMTVVTAALIDRRSRRLPLSVSLAGMTLTFVVLDATFYLPGFSGLVGTVATGNLMLYVVLLAVGLGPAFWFLTSEIHPLKVCGTAMGVVTVLNWVADLVISLAFPVMATEITTAGTLWVFAVLSVAALAFTYWFAPGMKGRSLGAIESDLRENVLGGPPDGSSAGTVFDDD